MLETKPANISIKILKSAHWTEDAGFQSVGSWLRLSTAHQEQIDVVQAQNDFLALGARRAMEEQTTTEDKKSRGAVSRRRWSAKDWAGLGSAGHFGGYHCRAPNCCARSKLWLLRFRVPINRRSALWFVLSHFPHPGT
jgi:hypothetical protein